MRIVGGRFRGRRLETPPKNSKDQRIRPTSDRAREAIFNLLAHHAPEALDSTRVLDLFAGSGALGLEAVSRGAAQVTFVDQDPRSLALAKRNAETLDADAAFIRADATRLPQAPAPAALIFCDAPYGRGLTEPALASAVERGWINDGTVLVIETSADEEVALPDGFTVLTNRTYGAAKISIYQLLNVTPDLIGGLRQNG